MKVSKSWLKQLVKLNTSIEEVEKLLPLRTIGTKEITDRFIELDMKGYNRADLLSMRGAAYEIAAITGSSVTFREEELANITKSWEKYPSLVVKVEVPEIVPLYCLAKIEGLKIADSPADWQEKLADCGVRSINNVADITNLVMLEYGQPLHAFDSEMAIDQTVIVRTAKDGEEIITLDGKKRQLISTDLIIADSEKALGLAGVMGGKDSEVRQSTNTILLEAAIFDPVTLRKSSQNFGLSSEASKRFQHGLTKKRLIQALAAAIKYYEDLGGKLTGISVVGFLEEPAKNIELAYSKLNSLVGVNIPEDFVTSSLEKLHFLVSPLTEGVRIVHLEGVNMNQKKWSIGPPYFRLDVNIEVDVIEEIARMYGYEKIPAQALSSELELSKTDQSFYQFIRNLKERLVNLGLTEVQTYSFYSTKALENLNPDKLKLIKISNPMSLETEYMRDYLWPNLLEISASNIRKYQYEDIGIFEIGKTYEIQENQLPKEKLGVSILLTGKSAAVSQELSSLLKKLSDDLNLGLTIKQTSNTDNNLFNPQAYAEIFNQANKKIGILTEVHPRITDSFGINQRVAVLGVEFGMK